MQQKILISLTGAILTSCFTSHVAFGSTMPSGDAQGAAIQSFQKLSEKPEDSREGINFRAIAPQSQNLLEINSEATSGQANNSGNFVAAGVGTPGFADTSLLPSNPAVNSNADNSSLEFAVNPYVTPEIIPNVAPTPQIRAAFQQGEASWYGPGFDGNYTASGEVFNRYAMTAAHPSLPFGTRVLVTNMETGRSIVVRVTDRGPFVGDRIIDLSEGAAESIGLVDAGVGDVRLDIIQP